VSNDEVAVVVTDCTTATSHSTAESRRVGRCELAIRWYGKVSVCPFVRTLTRAVFRVS